MNQTEREKMARAMGLDPVAFEEYRRTHPIAGVTGSLSLGASRDATATGPSESDMAALDRVRLCRAFGVKPEDFERWRASQLQLAQDQTRRREPLTYVQEALLAEAPPAAPAPIVPTAEERALAHGEMVRRAVTVGNVEGILKNSSAAPSGRLGIVRMDSRFIRETR